MRAVYPYSSRLFTIYSQKDKIDWVNQNQIKRFLVWYIGHRAKQSVVEMLARGPMNNRQKKEV